MLSATDSAVDFVQIGSSWCPGTCGELVQGFHHQGNPFHVTFPIKKYSKAKVSVTAGTGIEIVGLRESEDKTASALRKAAAILGHTNICIGLERETELQVGKGMASSTADIMSAADALAVALRRTLSIEMLGNIATSIESSDGLMYPGMAAVDHKSGRLVARYEWCPQFNVVILIPPQILHTEVVRFAGKESLSAEYDEILDRLEIASKERDETEFARAGTKSAILNQKYVPNPYFATLYPELDSMGALGINVAHTGTMAGVIFGSGQAELAEKVAAKLKAFFPAHTVEVTQVEGLRRWE